MNSRTRTGIIIAVAGLVLIVLGLYGVVRFLNLGLPGRQSAAPTPAATTRTKVAFATHDVTMGTVLAAADVELRDVPIELAPRDAVTNLDDAVGRISKVDMTQGEMVQAHNLANPTGQSYDVAWVLDDRHVLMALNIGDLMTQQALVRRGDIIDLYASYKTQIHPTDPNDQVVTLDSFQRLDITAIVVDIVQSKNEQQQQAGTTGGAPNRNQVAVQAYLLALDPQDALVLKFLKDTGAIFDIVLRAPTSSAKFDLTPVTVQYIHELYGLGLLP